MVKIRLAQTGTKNRKTYRIVAIDEQKRRNGRAIEVLGYLDPLIKPQKLVVRMDRVDYWKSVGAQMTQSVRDLLASQYAQK